MAAVERHDAELHPVVAEQARASRKIMLGRGGTHGGSSEVVA
jgi:hypothetical protein